MVQVRLFGQPRALHHGEWEAFPLDRRGAFLAYLAFRGDWVNRDRLTFLFWPDNDNRKARANLRQLLMRARQVPYAELIEVETERLRWPVATDVMAFRQYLAAGDWRPAVETYDGHLLTPFDLAGAEGFGAWLELEREQLRSSWRNATIQVGEELEQAGSFAAAAAALRRLLDDEQLVEDVLQRYLRTAYLAGQRDLALQVFERFARQLKAELDLEPLESTLALVAVLREAGGLERTRSDARSTQRIPVAVLRPPRLVGRGPELRRIDEAATPVVAVAGEAGVGKSRLLGEAAPGALWLRCQEGLQGVPYYPAINLVREAAASRDTLPELGPYLEDLVRLIPEIAPDLDPGPADPESGRYRLFESLALLLEGLRPPAADVGAGFGLVADDLQWADEATLEFLLFLANRGRVRVLGGYRHHEVGPALERALQALRSSGLLTRVELEPLGREAVAELMGQLMGREGGPPIFSQWLHAHTGGNPLFALETLKSLFESSALSADETGWHTAIDEVTRDYSELRLPTAVSDLVLRRLDKLSPEAQRVLKIAAAFGRSFDADLLSRVSGLSGPAVIDAIEEAERVGIFHQGEFRHDLLRQGVYQSLGETRRTLAHQRIAEALTGNADPGVVAEHWLRGQKPGRAVPLWLEVAEAYYDRGLLPQAAELYRRALDHAPDPAGSVPIQLRLARAHLYAGDYSRTREVAEQILTDPRLDPRLLAAALKTLAEACFREGNLAEAESNLERSLALEPEFEDPALVSELWEVRANIAFYRGDFDTSSSFLQKRLAFLERAGPSAELAQALASLAATVEARGENEEALGLDRSALAMARAVGARHIEVLAASNQLSSCMNLGRTEEALADAEHALTLGHYENSDSLRNNLAVAYRRLGRLEESIDHHERLTHSRNAALATIATARLAGIHAQRGRPAEAERWLERALERLATTDLPFARAVVAIAVLEHGTDRQLPGAERILAGLDPEQLPVHIQAQLEEARARRGPAS